MPAKVKVVEVDNSANEELACTYAALILHDDNITVTDEKIKAILAAAKMTVKPYLPGLFARVVSNPAALDDLILKGGAGAGAAAAAPAGAAPAAGGAKEDKKEEKKKVVEEKKEESDDDMGLGLFD